MNHGSRHHHPVPPAAALLAAPHVASDWRRHLGVAIALAAVATLLYAPSLHAPWYMDDTPAIVQNSGLRNLWGSLGNIFLPRGLPLFSFALNFHFGGLDPFGYHVVNLALHGSSGFLVYLLLRQMLRDDLWSPLLGALIFIAHPLQTQAVTYVVQRMAVLAALFFLLALYLFARARTRLAAGTPFADGKHLGLYLGAVVAGWCAIFTKENAVVLPLVLYLHAAVLAPPTSDRRRLVLSLLPFAAGSLLLVALQLLFPLAAGETLQRLASTTRLATAPHFTPLHYLVTEFSVLWVYLRMLFLPYGQALDHSYPLAVSLFELRHLVAGAGLLLLGVLAVRIRQRQPLLAGGIAWFFLTLAVESSIIPLDPLFEHRLYLPMFGFVLVLLGLVRLLPDRRSGAVILLLAVLLYLPLSWQRNRLWADPIAFYHDNLSKVPHSESVLSDLAVRYFDAGRFAEAEPLLKQALAYNPGYLLASLNLLDIYIAQGRLPEAFTLAQQALSRYPRSVKLLAGLGILYEKSGNVARALYYLDRALQLDPDYLLGLRYRAGIYAETGRFAEAEEGFRRVLTLDEDNLDILSDLVFVLAQQGKRRDAEELLRRLRSRDPQRAQRLAESLFGDSGTRH